jgi:hypothetical protein
VSGLNGRVRALERQGHLAAGCQTCGSHAFRILEPGEYAPSWLDALSRCRGCGHGVKLIDRDSWDLL